MVVCIFLCPVGPEKPSEGIDLEGHFPSMTVPLPSWECHEVPIRGQVIEACVRMPSSFE